MNLEVQSSGRLACHGPVIGNLDKALSCTGLAIAELAGGRSISRYMKKICVFT